MTKRCLLVIDLINDYLNFMDETKITDLIAATNALVAAFRHAGLPVIWVRQAFLPDLSDAFLEMRDRNISIAIEGTPGAQFHADLLLQPDDTILVKKRYSAFFQTPLDDLLARMGTSELVLCGINTHACIRTVAIDAYQRDFRVILAKECIGSYDTEHERVSLTYMDGKIAKVATVAEIVCAIRCDDAVTSSERGFTV